MLDMPLFLLLALTGIIALAGAFEPRSYLSHPQQDDIYKLHRCEYWAKYATTFKTKFSQLRRGTFQTRQSYFTYFRLEKLCSANGSKVRSSLGTEVNVFTFNSSSGLLPGGRAVFSCHLELFLPSSLYGFSVFIEEMSLGPHSTGGCRRDYLQFGRDILFLTTHRR
jgi:hypothetical protein